MAILRQKRDEKGNMHKMVMFELGGGAKLHKKLGQKLLAISLCVTMVLLGVPATTFADEEDPVTSGQCGDNVTWKYDDTNNALTIKGSGAMWYMNTASGEAWKNYQSEIKYVYIQKGVSSISNMAFEYCTSLRKIDIPDTVKSIGNRAFAYCSTLDSITIPPETSFIGDLVFIGCTNLKNITVNETNETYSSIDGVLFKGGTVLLQYPAGKTDNHYDIPDATNTIEMNAFSYSQLYSITIPELVNHIEISAFVNTPYLNLITLPCKSNQNIFKDAYNSESTFDIANDSLTIQYANNTNKAIALRYRHEFTFNDNKDGTHTATCTAETCCKKNGTQPYAETIKHTSNEQFEKDGEHHWRNCDFCKGMFDKATHTWDGDNVCDICGYQKPKQDEPTSSDENKKPETTPTKPQKPETPTDDLSTDHSNWGTEKVYAKIKHYVDESGKTSVEVTSENLDENSILWLKEESYDATAWYGIDLSDDAFDLDKGHRFYVQWLSPNDDDYKTYYSQLDDARKAEVEGNKGWIFLIGVENHENKTVQPRKPVKVFVQIGDDWDKKDLQGYYISSAQDEQVTTTFVDNLTYPAGTDTFGLMTLSHFSPYFIYDKLTDDEKAAFDALTDEKKTQLNAAAKELAAQQNEKSDKTSESKSEKNSSGSSAKTGDEIIYFTISGVSLMMTLALGLMLNSKINRRKLDK